MMNIILYSKPGCHLCEGLEEKLRAMTDISLQIEVRDITTNNNWFELYQYEIPVMFLITQKGEKLIPRTSPRVSVIQLRTVLQRCAE